MIELRRRLPRLVMKVAAVEAAADAKLSKSGEALQGAATVGANLFPYIH